MAKTTTPKGNIIESTRRRHGEKCVNCAHCEFDLTDEEVYDGRIDSAHTGACRRYPPDIRGEVPEVRILEDYCGEKISIIYEFKGPV